MKSSDKATDQLTKREFSYRHIVTFADTNLMGNVYFVNHVAWQGRCREAFLRSHVPHIEHAFGAGLRLVTLRVSCEYYAELQAFDDVELRMSLSELNGGKLSLTFEYFVDRNGAPTLAATGSQEIACFIKTHEALSPCDIPASLADAIRRFNESEVGAGAARGTSSIS